MNGRVPEKRRRTERRVGSRRQADRTRALVESLALVFALVLFTRAFFDIHGLSVSNKKYIAKVAAQFNSVTTARVKNTETLCAVIDNGYGQIDVFVNGQIDVFVNGFNIPGPRFNLTKADCKALTDNIIKAQKVGAP
jgi:hypothetical protein